MNWKRGLFRFWLVVSVVGFLIAGYIHHVPIAIYTIYTGAPTSAQYAAQQQLRNDQWSSCVRASMRSRDGRFPWEQYAAAEKKCGPDPEELPPPPMVKDIAVDSLIAFADFGGSVALFLGAVIWTTAWIVSGLRQQNSNQDITHA